MVQGGVLMAQVEVVRAKVGALREAAAAQVGLLAGRTGEVMGEVRAQSGQKCQ